MTAPFFGDWGSDDRAAIPAGQPLTRKNLKDAARIVRENEDATFEAAKAREPFLRAAEKLGHAPFEAHLVIPSNLSENAQWREFASDDPELRFLCTLCRRRLVVQEFGDPVEGTLVYTVGPQEPDSCCGGDFDRPCSESKGEPT